jgi:hypothetical protein
MLSVKWKLYKIANYILLISSAIFILVIFSALLRSLSRGAKIEPVVYLIALLFILITANTIVNLVLLAKNFPDRELSGFRALSNSISIIINIATVIGHAIFVASGFIAEFDRESASPDPTGKIMLALFALLWFVNLFVLICQFSVRRYLRENNNALIDSIIGSIGTKS